jgi:hypothetical protein
MAKGPTIKFPRIEAGFYNVTKDGEMVGYIMKEVDADSKETNWYVFDDITPGKDIAMLNPNDAIDSPDSLFREAKESAKTYFSNMPAKVETPMQMAPVESAQWSEDEDKDEETTEDFNLYVSDDGEFEAFEDELEFASVDVDELALV